MTRSQSSFILRNEYKIIFAGETAKTFQENKPIKIWLWILNLRLHDWEEITILGDQESNISLEANGLKLKLTFAATATFQVLHNYRWLVGTPVVV